MAFFEGLTEGLKDSLVALKKNIFGYSEEEKRALQPQLDFMKRNEYRWQSEKAIEQYKEKKYKNIYGDLYSDGSNSNYLEKFAPNSTNNPVKEFGDSLKNITNTGQNIADLTGLNGETDYSKYMFIGWMALGVLLVGKVINN